MIIQRLAASRSVSSTAVVLEQGGSAPYDEALLDVVHAIGDSDDLALVSAAMTRDAVNPFELLCFLLSGMGRVQRRSIRG